MKIKKITDANMSKIDPQFGSEDFPTVTIRRGAESFEVARIYMDFRDMIFDIEIGLNSADDKVGTVVGAVLVEFGYPAAALTLLAMPDETVSLYSSSGGGIIGAGCHDHIAKASIELIDEAKKYSKTAEHTTSRDLPEPERVRFYIIANQGIFMIDATESDLRQGKHDASPLYRQTQKVMILLREMDEASS